MVHHFRIMAIMVHRSPSLWILAYARMTWVFAGMTGGDSPLRLRKGVRGMFVCVPAARPPRASPANIASLVRVPLRKRRGRPLSPSPVDSRLRENDGGGRESVFVGG